MEKLDQAFINYRRMAFILKLCEIFFKNPFSFRSQSGLKSSYERNLKVSFNFLHIPAPEGNIIGVMMLRVPT